MKKVRELLRFLQIVFLGFFGWRILRLVIWDKGIETIYWYIKKLKTGKSKFLYKEEVIHGG